MEACASPLSLYIRYLALVCLCLWRLALHHFSSTFVIWRQSASACGGLRFTTFPLHSLFGVSLPLLVEACASPLSLYIRYLASVCPCLWRLALHHFPPTFVIWRQSASTCGGLRFTTFPLHSLFGVSLPLLVEACASPLSPDIRYLALVCLCLWRLALHHFPSTSLFGVSLPLLVEACASPLSLYTRYLASVCLCLWRLALHHFPSTFVIWRQSAPACGGLRFTTFPRHSLFGVSLPLLVEACASPLSLYIRYLALVCLCLWRLALHHFPPTFVIWR